MTHIQSISTTGTAAAPELVARIEAWNYSVDLLGPYPTLDEIDELLATAPSPDLPLACWLEGLKHGVEAVALGVYMPSPQA